MRDCALETADWLKSEKKAAEKLRRDLPAIDLRLHASDYLHERENAKKTRAVRLSRPQFTRINGSADRRA